MDRIRKLPKRQEEVVSKRDNSKVIHEHKALERYKAHSSQTLRYELTINLKKDEEQYRVAEFSAI